MKKQEIFRGGLLDSRMGNGCTGVWEIAGQGVKKVCILHKLL